MLPKSFLTDKGLLVQGRRLKVSHVVGLASAAIESSQSSPRSQEVLNADSSNGNAQQNAEGNAQSSQEEHPLLAQPPTEWFGPLAEGLLALQPQKLGKVLFLRSDSHGTCQSSHCHKGGCQKFSASAV